MDHSRSTFSAPRRVMTAPQGSVCSPSSSSQSAPGLVETLYNHPNVKIIAFTASGRSRARSPGRAPPDEEPGSLSSSSQLERTIAIGPFRIYRAPGSVAFLNCGSALQPILPKSQCWCIDEVSNKFVLQIRRPQYWRIEVPVSDPEEKELAHALRGVFDQILQFEKTACPFKRSFTIALPEKPKTPIKKRPWTPVRRSDITPTATTIVEATTTPPARTTRRKSESPAARQLKASMKASFTADEDTTTRSEIVPDTAVQRTNVQAPEAQTPEVQAPDAQGVPPVSSVAEDDMSTQIEDITEVSKQPNDASGRNTADETENRDKEEIPVTDDRSVFEQPESDHNTLKILPATSACEPDATVILATTNDVNDGTRVRTEATEAEQSQEIPLETGVPLAPMQSQPLSVVRDISTPQSNSPPTLLPVQEAQEVSEELPPLTAIRREEPSSVPPDFSTPETAVELTPRHTSTHARPDIHDFLRAYEQKAAAEAPTKADIEHSIVLEDVELPATADDDIKSTASVESGPETAETEQTSAEVLEGSGVVGARRKKLRGFRAGRSLAVPPQLTLITSPPSKSAASKQSPIRLPEDAKGQISPAGSSDSFHSVQSWQSPLSSPGSQPTTPSTFPYPHDNILMPMRISQYRDISDLTVTPDTKRTWDAASFGTNESSQESAATAPDMASETAEQAGKDSSADGEAKSTAVARRRPSIRHRATASSISVSRALSPLPPAANLFSPTATSMRRLPTRSRLDLVRRVPMAIVAKTCEILLSPPSHLMNLMLRVAARIAAGEWRGMMFGYGESGETIPVQWDYSDGELSDWGDDDDFYMSQTEGSRAPSVADQQEARDRTARGWEVD
ncbi:conserved hypothetical protein [Verticillium alfalfae VaMs.102]|uniref:Inheritance of peroxisomes protein 1 n=1 Tax=Verticillium alfalfae (strain VaMs.102 / ATCC MYA-4576 / FGSC 10136) TaxID=526221 RepID=C9SRC6_VERA1|nr:conserved hypothetical protein [Verticillium alfalfae VaMs.102]EEY21341.1 conserved hypothetical protein [Verticillium alfalfae VaMs.102]